MYLPGFAGCIQDDPLVADLEEEVQRLRTGTASSSSPPRNSALKAKAGEQISLRCGTVNAVHNGQEEQEGGEDTEDDVDVEMEHDTRGLPDIDEDDELDDDNGDHDELAAKSETPMFSGVIKSQSARAPDSVLLPPASPPLPAHPSPGFYLPAAAEVADNNSHFSPAAKPAIPLRRTSLSSNATGSISATTTSTPQSLRQVQRLPSISALLNDVDTGPHRDPANASVASNSSISSPCPFVQAHALISTASPFLGGSTDNRLHYNRSRIERAEELVDSDLRTRSSDHSGTVAGNRYGGTTGVGGRSHNYGLLSPPSSGRLGDPHAVSSSLAARHATMSAPLPALRLPSPSASTGWRHLELGAPALPFPDALAGSGSGPAVSTHLGDGRGRSHSYSYSHPQSHEGNSATMSPSRVWTHEDESAASLLLHISSRSSASGSSRSVSTSMSPSAETRRVTAATFLAPSGIEDRPRPGIGGGEETVKAQTPGGMLGLAFP